MSKWDYYTECILDLNSKWEQEGLDLYKGVSHIVELRKIQQEITLESELQESEKQFLLAKIDLFIHDDYDKTMRGFKKCSELDSNWILPKYYQIITSYKFQQYHITDSLITKYYKLFDIDSQEIFRLDIVEIQIVTAIRKSSVIETTTYLKILHYFERILQLCSTGNIEDYNYPSDLIVNIPKFLSSCPSQILKIKIAKVIQSYMVCDELIEEYPDEFEVVVATIDEWKSN